MPLPFVFGVHNHQPLGNFDYVIERLTQECYRPFLQEVARYPHFRFSLHTSGILLKWWEEHAPELFELLGRLIADKQIEPVLGGFFEPILAVIPEEDRKEQILRLKDYIKRVFGVLPSGLWLTERVWEQSLVKDLVDLGIKYVVVDDRHFLVSGFEKHELYGYYLTETDDKRLAVFPIDETLRYAIPLWPVENLKRYLDQISLRGGKLAVYFDDGEKFGAWPGTYQWVYEKGWLRKFLEATARWQEEGSLQILTYAEALTRIKPQGLAYLPTASYKEMEEWALPAPKILELEQLKQRLGADGSRFQTFIRGGHWRNFFVKYPESNYLHKRMYQVSKLTREPKAFDEEARLALLAAQCNDAYWHGIFGGLYLPHLRHAVWNKLLEAESKLRASQAPSLEFVDIDCDGQEEILYASPEAVLVFRPHYGGQLVEWSSLKIAHNYSNVLTRRFEAYHEGITHSEIREEEPSEVASIHNIRKRPPQEVLDALIYDWYQRHSLIEHFFDPLKGLNDFVACDFGEWGDFANQPFSFHRAGDELLLFRDGGLYPPGSARRPLLLRKFIRINQAGLEINVRYEMEYRAHETTHSYFGVEFNFYPSFMTHGEGRLSIDDVPQDHFLPFEAQGSTIALEDRRRGETLRISLREKTRIFCFPIKTVSQSEEGFDLTVQGLALMPFWPVEFEPGKKERRQIKLELLS